MFKKLLLFFLSICLFIVVLLFKVQEKQEKIVIESQPKLSKPQDLHMSSVMILEKETTELSVSIIKLLKNNCTIDIDKNGTKIHSYRQWKNTYKFEQIKSNPDKIIQLYRIAQRDSRNSKLPWIVISDKNGKILMSGQFPTNEKEQLKLFKNFGAK